MEEERPQGPPRRNHGGPPLQQYRLYFLESPEGHFSRAHEFMAGDDEQAVKIAAAWLEGRRAELWCGDRKLMSWEARS